MPDRLYPKKGWHYYASLFTFPKPLRQRELLFFFFFTQIREDFFLFSRIFYNTLSNINKFNNSLILFILQGEKNENGSISVRNILHFIPFWG